MKENLVSVCICTFKRPEYLIRLLKELAHQKTEGLFTYDVVVVDNDYAQSARAVVESAKSEMNIEISYHCEVEQNISLARNRAVKVAKGEFVALIDDDEFPVNGWLLHLFKSMCEYQAAGVLGPVKPHFEDEQLEWVLRGKLCDRDSFPTGTLLTNPRYTRTGNVLLSKVLFKQAKDYFNPVFGRTGGEDVDFFKRMIQKGFQFVWNDEAVVFESVPHERTTRKYFLKRALLRGVTSSKQLSISSVTKSFVATFLYTIALPFLFLAGQHLFMKYLIKDCDHIGKLLGICGLNIVKEKNF
ncbi:MAG: glycosyltransferase family 2 protein [Colwellia sp.]|nr:glycosyltransferase family 2 protein [Colwellia sp.]